MADRPWLEKQNSEDAITARAASDYYWEVVQRLRAAEFLVFVVVPTALAIVAQFIHALDTPAAVAAFAMTVLDAGLAYPWISRSRRQAAQAQDRFDSLALSLPLSRMRQIAGPDTSDLRSASSHQNKARSKNNRDWYTPELGSLPLNVGRLACMRETTSWDGGLRQRYVWLIASLVVLVPFVFITYAIRAHLTMEEFVVRILFPMTPAILWAGREIWDNRDASETVGRIRDALINLWDDVLEGNVSQESLATQTLEIDSAIFMYRQNTPPVPNALYKLLRSRTTRTMQDVAHDLIREYEDRQP